MNQGEDSSFIVNIAGVELIEACLDLLRDPYWLYRRCSDDQRRELNIALFTHIYLDDATVSDQLLEQPFSILQSLYHQQLIASGLRDPDRPPPRSPIATGTKRAVPQDGSLRGSGPSDVPPIGDFSNRPYWVEVLHSYSNKARHYLYHLDQIVEAAQALPKAPKPRKPAAKSSTKLIHRLSTHQVAAMTDRYKQGWSSQRIAETYNISKTSVVQLLRDAGAPIRRQGLTAEQATEAARLYKDGQSLARIGERFAVSPGCVRQSLIEQGMTLRRSRRHC